MRTGACLLLLLAAGPAADERRAPPSTDLRAGIRHVASLIAEGAPERTYRDAWIRVVAASKNLDVDAAVRDVIAETKAELSRRADAAGRRVTFLASLGKELRDDSARIDVPLARPQRAGETWSVPQKAFKSTPGPRGEVVVESRGLLTTRAQAAAYRAALAAQLAAVGDDARIADIDLQNVLQKQQQTLQKLSSISKMLYDTAMAVMRQHGS